jgi:hypothetical protein
MNNTNLYPGSGLHPDGSYVAEDLLVYPQILFFLVSLQWLLPLIAVTLAYYPWSSRLRNEQKVEAYTMRSDRMALKKLDNLTIKCAGLDRHL